MLNLIRGEIYRLLHKKSMYIFFGSLAVGYFLLAFIRSGGFGEESVVTDAMNFFFFLPATAGGFLFSAIYTDDLNSKNLTALTGFGMNKAKIVTAKFILAVLSGTIIFGLAPLFHCAVYAALGCAANTGIIMAVYAISIKFMLITLAFSALSGIAVYGFQRTTFAIVLYILLAFNVVGSLLAAALKPFVPNLAAHLMSGITDRIFACVISGVLPVLPAAEYILYTAIALSLSIMVFYLKEMEF